MLAWGWWKTVEEVIYCFTNNQHDILWKLWKPIMVAQLKQEASFYKYLIWICFLRRVDAEHQKCEALRCRRLWMPGNLSAFLKVFLWSLFENDFLEKMKNLPGQHKPAVEAHCDTFCSRWLSKIDMTFFTLHSCHVCLHICRVVYLFLTIFSEPYTEIMGDSPGSTLYIDIRLESFLNYLCWVEYFWDFIFFIWEICFGMKFVFPYPVLDITNWNCGMCLPAWLQNV